MICCFSSRRAHTRCALVTGVQTVCSSDLRRLPDTNPRKLPRQERSKATVEAILIAATQVLIEDGYERATTARVAERAGVSVGSLYQYFPNKEALVGTLVEIGRAHV